MNEKDLQFFTFSIRQAVTGLHSLAGDISPQMFTELRSGGDCGRGASIRVPGSYGLTTASEAHSPAAIVRNYLEPSAIRALRNRMWH